MWLNLLLCIGMNNMKALYIKNRRRKWPASYLPIETLGFTRQNLCTGYKAVVIEACNKEKR